MRFLIDVALVHFLIGAGLGIGAVVLFQYQKRRRPIFRFGGNDPLSGGEKRFWMLWGLCAFGFELITSFHPTVSLYLELGLSAIEAFFLTLGLFVIDRAAMMFEPESNWKKEEKKSSHALLPPAKQTETVVPRPATTPTELTNEESWVERNARELSEAAEKTTADIKEKTEDVLAQAKETVNEATHAVVQGIKETAQSATKKAGTETAKVAGTVRGRINKYLENRRTARETARTKEAEAKKDADARFDELTRSHRPR